MPVRITDKPISPLRRRMVEDMTIRNLSPMTQRSYLHAVEGYSRYFGRSPDRLGLEDVRAYQVHLAGNIQMIDSSSIRVDQHAANAQKKTTDPVAWVARAARLTTKACPREGGDQYSTADSIVYWIRACAGMASEEASRRPAKPIQALERRTLR